MRMKLESERLKRRLVLLSLAALVLLAGGIVELYHRPIALAELNVKVIAGLLIVILVNALPVFVALAVIPRLASRFIHALYDTKDREEAHDFLRRNVFGMSALRPLLIVKEGRVAVAAGSLSDRVGGRALLIVYNDSAVVLEKGGRLTRVVGPSLSFLEPFERVWEVVDLRRQRWPLTVNAMTKEGIPVACQADVTFKIDDRFVDQWGDVQTKPPVEIKTRLPTDEEIDEGIARELEKAGIAKPLPYTDEAVVKAATSIWVRIRQREHPEQLRKWTGRVVFGEVEDRLRSILADYRLDWLMRPPQPGHEHPREEIREQLKQELRDALPVNNELGARILHVDLGQIDVKDERISTQWVDAWRAGWEQKAVESLAEGEAEMTRLQAVQVQAQAEMVLALTEAIRPFVISEEDLSAYTLATHFVEGLWWMSYAPWMRAFMPPEAMRTLEELEKILGKKDVPLDETLPGLRRLLIERRGGI